MPPGHPERQQPVDARPAELFSGLPAVFVAIGLEPCDKTGMTRMKSSKNKPVRSGPRVVAMIADVRETPYREAAKGAAQFGCEAGDWQIEILSEDAARFTQLPAWREGGFDGIIAVIRDERVARAVAAALPHVDADNVRIASLAFEHLRERGLANFGFYAEPCDGVETASLVRGDTFMALVAAGGSLVRGSSPARSPTAGPRPPSSAAGWPGSPSPSASWPATIRTPGRCSMPAEPRACGYRTRWP